MRPPSQGTKPYQAHLSMCCFCVQMYSFTGLIRRTSPSTFSDTAITDRHSDTTFFQHWVWISWSWIRKIVRTCAAGRSRTLEANTLSTRPGAPFHPHYLTWDKGVCQLWLSVRFHNSGNIRENHRLNFHVTVPVLPCLNAFVYRYLWCHCVIIMAHRRLWSFLCTS